MNGVFAKLAGIFYWFESGRGLKEGMAADIVIFDEKEVKDVSTFEKPHAGSKGFHYVIVNGMLTVDNEKHNGTRAGKALYGPGKNSGALAF